MPRCTICNTIVDGVVICDDCYKKYPRPSKRDPVGPAFDPARHPSHYHEGKGIDPIGVMRETFNASELEGFFKGSALKYIMRYQSKNGKQDLEKAKFYVEQLISLYTGEVPNGNETK